MIVFQYKGVNICSEEMQAVVQEEQKDACMHVIHVYVCMHDTSIV